MDPKGCIIIYMYRFTYIYIYTGILVYIYMIYTPNLMISSNLEAALLWFIDSADFRWRMETNLAEQLVRETQLDWKCFLDLHHLHPKRLTIHPLKWMVGRWLKQLSFWEANFSGASIVKLWGGVHPQPQATIQMSRWKSSTEFGSRSIMKQNAAPG